MNASPVPARSTLRSRIAFFAAAFLFCTLISTNALAQPGMPTGANYIDDMPSVDKVKATIQGTDPIDTAARQVAVFDELVSYIDRVHTNRDVRSPMLPAEGKLWGDYRLASYQITQDFTKSRSAADAQKFTQLEGKYSFDSAFMNAWPKQLIVGQANAALQNANAGLAASSKRMYDKQMQDNQQAQQAQAQTTNAQGLSNDPTAVATRRCLELGGDNLACVGKGLGSGLMDMITGGTGLESITGPGRAGVVLSGTYGGGVATNVSFGGDSGTLNGCGKLANDGYAYTLNKTATALKVTLATSPNPLVLTMRSDGSLSGPGLITINGRVITGYEIITHYRNGIATGSDRIPQYAPATDRCTLGALGPPPPPAPSDNSNSGQVGGMLGALMNTVASALPTASLPGLRMEGKYSSTGLLFDFAGDAVTIDCGQAHVKAPYTVENGPSSLVVHVKNSGGPFDLIASSDNTLRGAGSTTINGRLVTGMNGDNVTFMPHSETCQVGSYSPQSGAGSTTIVAANASPAPVPTATPAPAAVATPPVSAATSSTGAMTLAITSTFPIAKNPLAGAIVKLMTDRFDNVLRKAGAPVPDGTTPGLALAAYVQNCPPPTGCPAAAQVMHPYYVGTATFDGNGAATIHADVPPGNYYILCTANGTSGALVWDMPVTLKSGQKNSIQLTATNAELVK
jgi:hypothetical protein